MALIAPHAPSKATGRRPFPIGAMLRIHFLQQWFGLSDVAREEALYDVPQYREFAGLGGMSRLPDRVSILRLRHLLERHQLAEQILKTVNAQLSAKGYTTNARGSRRASAPKWNTRFASSNANSAT